MVRQWGLVLLTSAACTSDGGDASGGTDLPPDPTGVPSAYTFAGRDGSPSSVDTAGQVLRHVLTADLDGYLGELTPRLQSGLFPVAGEIESDLGFYFDFDSTTGGQVAHGVVTDPAPLQAVYDDLAVGKNLAEKVAGNDPEGQHENWSTDLIGWPGSPSPEALVRGWFAEVDAAAVAWSNGDVPLDPSGVPVDRVTLGADGLDRQELIQKFLLGAIAYSQGTDDYLDDADAGGGLLASHVHVEGPYTELEHAWDEGFGYFGAPRDWATWTDDTTADVGHQDTLAADGAIDLTSEAAFGHAVNAAKRDRDAASPTDFTADAFAGFLAGRTLLAGVDGELSEAQAAELRGYRDDAVQAWENAIAATVVHYINDVLKQMSAFGTAEYHFGDHAAEWSELKGFALALQFNPRSRLSDDDLVALHALLGDAPVLATASASEITAYSEDLLAARALVGAAMGFDAANLGDAGGENGW